VSNNEQHNQQAIHRYEIPVDDRWHILGLSGPVVHVASRRPNVVEVWAIRNGGPELMRILRVFGTGQPMLADLRWVVPRLPLTGRWSGT
jgi:hypothetical protein